MYALAPNITANTDRVDGSLLPHKNRRTPHRSAKSTAAHATTPTKPVVTNVVGINPTPELKSTFQKSVWFIPVGLNSAHERVNVLGPVPNMSTLGLEKAFWPIMYVPCQEGRTSSCAICNEGGNFA